MWAIYWRFMLAVFTVFLLTVLAVQAMPILQQVPDSDFHPSVFWLVACVFSLITTQLTSRGLVHAFIGKHLPLPANLWTRINISFSALFCFLAVLGLLVPFIVIQDIWALYKLYAQPLILILGPLAASSFVLHQVKHSNR